MSSTKPSSVAEINEHLGADDIDKSYNSTDSFITMDYTTCSQASNEWVIKGKKCYSDIVRNEPPQYSPLQLVKPTIQRSSSPLPSVTMQSKRHSSGLRAVSPPHERRMHREDNSSITGVFVSRLHPRTTLREVQQNVRHETGLSVKAYKMQTRNSNYSSFYIHANSAARDMLLHPDTWPPNAFIKPFYGQLRY